MHSISGWQVTCLCAAWCRTCDTYRDTFETVARDFPDWRFTWVDVEDRSDVLDDYDVLTFPTLLVGHGRTLRFAGPLTPHTQALARLLASLGLDQETAAADEAARLLWLRMIAANV